MKYNLDAIKRGEKQELSLDFQVNIDDIDYYGDVLKVVKPIDVIVKIYNIGDKLFLTCDIEGTLQVHCGRCLESFDYKLKTKIDAELMDEATLKEEDDFQDDIITYNEDEIDFEEVVKEQIATSIPMKLVCGQDCKGLCKKCGKNLNVETCKCHSLISEDEIDPRLDKLRDLL
ncbi:MAG: DUF177 domain-containing protein [Clostridiaceae bacterium]|nr:DUF177 domain-containing protein [Clostridiaceae bacterium]